MAQAAEEVPIWEQTIKVLVVVGGFVYLILNWHRDLSLRRSPSPPPDLKLLQIPSSTNSKGYAGEISPFLRQYLPLFIAVMSIGAWNLRDQSSLPAGAGDLFYVVETSSILGLLVPAAVGLMIGFALIWLFERLFMSSLQDDTVSRRVLVQGNLSIIQKQCEQAIRAVRARTDSLDLDEGRIEARRAAMFTDVFVTLKIEGEGDLDRYWITVAGRTMRPTTRSRMRNASIVNRGLENLTGVRLHLLALEAAPEAGVDLETQPPRDSPRHPSAPS